MMRLGLSCLIVLLAGCDGETPTRDAASTDITTDGGGSSDADRPPEGPLDAAGDGPYDASSAFLRLLVFTRTEQFRHPSIAAGLAMFRELAASERWAVTATEDPADFGANLGEVDVVVFLNTTGNVLGTEEEGAFEAFVAAGGGFVGIHAATDTEYEWAFYGDFLGAHFGGHPAIQEATVHVDAPDTTSTRGLPEPWVWRDEWYNFDRNPRTTHTVLLTVDEDTYAGGTMGADHPISWRGERGGGRVFYTALGHTEDAYADPLFRMHIAGGVAWAAHRSDAN